MFDLFDGLPVHPLVLHAVVVLAPLLALLALVYAFVPRTRAGMRWPLALLALVVMASAYVTKESGEKLEHRLKAQGENDPSALKLIHDHAEAGDLAFIACGLLGLAVLLSVFVLLPAVRRHADLAARDGDVAVRGDGATAAAEARHDGGGLMRLLGTALLVLTSLFACYAVFDAGHSGAKAAWGDQVDPTVTVTGGGGD